MFPAKLTKLIPLQPIRIILLVFVRRIIPLLAGRAGHIYNFAHFFTFVIRDP